MENNQVVIPDGWTYYTHRTNTERWSNNTFEKDIIVVYAAYQFMYQYKRDERIGYQRRK